MIYSNIDWLAVEFLDDYVSLSSEQEALLEEKVRLLVQWHKEEELPIYIQHLNELQNLTASSISVEVLQQHRNKVQKHFERLLSKIAPDLFSLSLQLSPEQEQEFLANVRDEYRVRDQKYLGKTEQEIRQIIYDKALEWLEDWIGEPNQAQKQRARQLSEQVGVSVSQWREYRASIYQELQFLFDNKNNAAVYQQVFMQLLFEPESYYSESLDKRLQENLKLTDQFTIEIAQSMTKRQWQHYYGKIDEWRELALDLSE
ncbi:DUF6279 family lipoprotein [Vibrio sp. CAU 1672]|uniref:DUF6279 family lipoprotein n=1 Tax=Vibrio sp. CAU 1672 TaxID=3032594 RepID=UPI0023D9A43D|nr:DUF6279 family lipoprotein [Vibrio sp. CAU 1672]MDF2152754.1 DUF6279 family lipoprotein [Vibrio sp. CAU 1672]